MVKRLALILLSLILILSVAPLALADADCAANISHYARAVQLHDMGDYTRALRHYNCALADDPDHAIIPVLIENLREDIVSAPTAWSAEPTGRSSSARTVEASFERADSTDTAPVQRGFIMPDWLRPYDVAPAIAQPAHSLSQITWLVIQPPPQASQELGLDFADYIDFADWFSKRGEWQRAAKSLERALELQPYHDDLRCRLGSMYQALGDDDAALAQFDHVISRDPSNICASENRRALHRAANATVQKAAPAPQAASPAQAIVTRALGYRDAGKLFAAANTLVEALALDSAHSQARCELAKIFSDWSNYGRALREFERILDHQPDDDCAIAGRLDTVEKLLAMYVPLVVDDYFYHARQYLRIEAWTQALAALERGLALDPTRSYMRCELGMVAWQLGDTRYALAQFDRILANDSLDPCASSNRSALMQRLRTE